MQKQRSFQSVCAIVLALLVWNNPTATWFGSRRHIVGRNVLLVHAQMQAQWTPNDSDDSGPPLPQSLKQRQQLLQLQQQIEQSPSPEATLHKVAEQNGMSPLDLQKMLQRNQADMAHHASSSANGMQTRQTSRNSPSVLLWTALTTIWSILCRIVLHNPRVSAMVVLTLMCWFYVCRIALPQTGVVWSQGPRRRFVTKGHTTLFFPPTHYLQQQVQVQQQQLLDDDAEDSDFGWSKDLDQLLLLQQPIKDDDVTWHDTKALSLLEGKRRFKTAVTAKIAVRHLMDTIRNADTSRNGESNDDDDKAVDKQSSDWYEEIRSIYLNHAARLLDQLELTEFASMERSVRNDKSATQERSDKLLLVSNAGSANGLNDDHDSSSDEQRCAILVVPGLGDWGRYGLLPLQASPVLDYNRNDNLDDDETAADADTVALKMSVPSGGHWTGEMYVTVQSQSDPADDDGAVELKVCVTLLVPRSSASGTSVSPSRQVGAAIAMGLARSIARSLQQRTQQTLARQHQSQRLQSATRHRALDRRANRSRLERQMEDMAVERRRRWQRKNPSGVSNYRPSGDRMRSPNHANYP